MAKEAGARAGGEAPAAGAASGLNGAREATGNMMLSATGGASIAPPRAFPDFVVRRYRPG